MTELKISETVAVTAIKCKQKDIVRNFGGRKFWQMSYQQ